MKKSLLIFAFLLVCMCCFAGQYLSVPVDHDVYRIIDWAVEADIIPVQTDVKPFNLDKVQSLLDTIYSSSKISNSQRAKIDAVKAEFEQTYGTIDSHSVMDIVENGYFGISNQYTNAKIGAIFETTQTFGLDNNHNDMVLDSRNRVSAYAKGDVVNAFSYDLNFTVMADKIAPTAFLPTDFNLDCEGFYVAFGGYLDRVARKNTFKIGYKSKPEISTSLFNGILSLRYASIKRDWGAGENNIVISPTAGAINAFDMTLQPFSWMTYSVVHGTLGKTSLGQADYKILGALSDSDVVNHELYGQGLVNGILYPSDAMHNDYYDNNIVAHKAELTLFKTVKLAVWESMVYRQRFQLSYINPFAIYMFEQNKAGDFDNVLAGFDASWKIKNFGTFYASFGMDELASFSGFLSNPRNIFAFQGGLKFKVPDAGFGEVTLQATYVPAFYGSHYGYELSESNPWGKTGYTTAYVNCGNCIGYPVNPDTLELLAEYETDLLPTLEMSVLGKIQLRSGQYATHATGTNILDTMNYAIYDANHANYAGRAFLSNIWDMTFDFELGVEKKFEEFPLALTGKCQIIVDRQRDILSALTTNPYNYNVHSTGYNVKYADGWKTNFNFNCSLGCKVYM